MTKFELFAELYKLYGAVSRARGVFVYTKKGVRLTDLYQEEGRAILGWEGGSAFTMFKNVLSRGLTGSFICEDSSRLQKAVSKLLDSERAILCFENKTAAMEAGLFCSPNGTSVYRPWNPMYETVNISEIDCVILTPPLAWSEQNTILAIKSNLIAEKPELIKQIRGTINLPFALEVAYTRAIFNLIKALQERQEKHWFIYDTILTKYWERKGPYLYPKLPKEKYNDFIIHCLNCGIVISPDYNNPSIVPFGAERGVFTKLKNSPFEY